MAAKTYKPEDSKAELPLNQRPGDSYKGSSEAGTRQRLALALELNHVTFKSQLSHLKSGDLILTKADSYKGISYYYLKGSYKQNNITLHPPVHRHPHTNKYPPPHTHSYTHKLLGPDSGHCGEKARPKHNDHHWVAVLASGTLLRL